jgi:hypothetical protein
VFVVLDSLLAGRGIVIDISATAAVILVEWILSEEEVRLG